MTTFNSRQRKTTSVVGILILLIPIVLLGMPASGRDSGGGGMLAKLRSEHDLGESDLGQIDPTSATMSFVLLGMRGIAVNMLRMDLDDYKDHKEWARMRATTEAVITLQPHYIEVWRFLAWNLAFNVSAEWDAVPDRYYWVKEGGKFSQRGTQRNATIPELTWETGRVWGQKIGMADEWRYFREYFKNDPDTKTFPNGVDPEINPNQIDNYLVAKEWFQKSNDREDNREQHIMMRALFRSQPMRTQLSYADALQRDVRFITADRFRQESSSDEEAEAKAYAARQANFALSRQEWAEGFTEWTTKFGQEEFQTPGGLIRMEADEDVVHELAERQKDQGATEADLRQWIDHYQKTTNYNYWRTRARAEADESTGTSEAHRLIYEGELKLRSGNPEEARQMLVRGMANFARLLEEYPDLRDEDLTVEEAVWGVLLWSKTLELLGESMPATFPLKATWDKYQGLLPELQERYNRGR
ncbi:hypothetical protein GC176_21810 [bacterium]|nr:hypothetical protein [bacterium]